MLLCAKTNSIYSMINNFANNDNNNNECAKQQRQLHRN